MSEKITVLVVEDEIDVRESLVGILQTEDFEVFDAQDGRQGLEMFLEKAPDIIISDIMMPDVTGYDLLQSVRKAEGDGDNVPFIFTSALGQKEDIVKGINLEANDYLVKPIDFDILIAKIKEKTNGVKKNKKISNKNITNLKSQVSNIVPGEMLQHVNLINQIAAVLRTEIYGPLPHRKYLDDINKIYVNSLKLQTIVNNFLSGAAISNQLDVEDEIIDPVLVLNTFMESLNEKFKSKIEIVAGNSANGFGIKVNKKILVESLRKIVGCLFKINEDLDIKITLSTDHLNRLAFIFYCELTVKKEVVESQMEKSSIAEFLDSQGLDLEIIENDDATNVVLLVPDYRVIAKK